MRFTLLTQLALLAISLVIVFSYIKPALGDIKLKQDEHFRYEDALAKAEQLNAELEALIARRDALSDADRLALDTFVPSRIDTLKIMRDIEGIFQSLPVPLSSLTASEPVLPVAPTDQFDPQLAEQAPVASSAGAAVVSQQFNLSFSGSYDDMKRVLQAIARNETLLEVVSFDLNPGGAQADAETRTEEQSGGGYSFSLTLRAYGLSI